MKSAPDLRKDELEIEMTSTPSDPNMDFNEIRETKTYSALNFEDTKDLNSSPGPNIDVSDGPSVQINVQVHLLLKILLKEQMA